jgi:predicted ABC-type ATPase/uncharacterized protein YuzE
MQNKRSHIKFSYSARVGKEIEIYEGILVEYDVNGSIIGLQIDNSIEKTLLPKLKAIFRSEGFNGNNKQQFQTTKKFAEPTSEYTAIKYTLSDSHIILICGPNGAGKSTAAPAILQSAFGIEEFINADTIAQGISAFKPENAAIKAGRIMLNRLRELADENLSFAFETTLSSRSFASWLKKLKQKGYRVSILFLWLESQELAIKRVAERVLHGGHNIDKDVIIRRYRAGLKNFFRVYCPLADHWKFYDNSGTFAPALIASGGLSEKEIVFRPDTWKWLREKYWK